MSEAAKPKPRREGGAYEIREGVRVRIEEPTVFRPGPAGGEGPAGGPATPKAKKKD